MEFKLFYLASNNSQVTTKGRIPDMSLLTKYAAARRIQKLASAARAIRQYRFANFESRAIKSAETKKDNPYAPNFSALPSQIWRLLTTPGDAVYQPAPQAKPQHTKPTPRKTPMTEEEWRRHYKATHDYFGYPIKDGKIVGPLESSEYPLSTRKK